MKSKFYSTASRGFYKPSATRTPVLVFLLVLTLVSIGLIELACYQIPAHSGFGRVGAAVDNVLAKTNAARDLIEDQSSSGIDSSSSAILVQSATSISSPVSAAPVPTPTSNFPSSTQASTTAASTAVPSSFSSTPTAIYQSTPVIGWPLPTPATDDEDTNSTTTTGHPGGGFLTPGDGSRSLVITSVSTGFLSLGDGSATGASTQDIPPLSTPTPGNGITPIDTATPTEEKSTYIPPTDSGDVSQSQPTSVPLGDGPSLTNGAAPVPPLTSSTVDQTHGDGSPTDGHLSLGGDGRATSLPVNVVNNGQTSAQAQEVSNSGPVTTPPPILLVAGGKISTQTGTGIATDSNGSPLPVLSTVGGQTFVLTPILTNVDGQTLAQTPILTVVDGKTFAVTPGLTIIGSQTFTETLILSVIDGKTIPITPGITLVNGHIITETPILTVIDGKTLALTPGVTVINGQTITETPVLTVIDGKTFALTPVITVIDGKTYTQTPILTVAEGRTYTETPYITVVGGTTYTRTPVPPTHGSGAMTTGGKYPSNIVPIAHPTATIVNSTGTYITYSDGETELAPQITHKQYIAVAFIPLILSVLYTIPWRILDTTIREIEPFYQLSLPNGAVARDSLCLDYSTSFLFTVPFKSMWRGHFIVFWSSLISLTVLLIAPLASETFFVSLTGLCGPGSEGPCHASWGIYPFLARFLQGILGFVAVLLSLIILFNYKRITGVYSEPLSIVGTAVLFCKSPVLRRLQEINSRVGNEELGKILEGRRFKLDGFMGEDGTKCYGVVSRDEDSEAGFVSRVQRDKDDKGDYSPVDTSDFGLDRQESSIYETETRSKTSRLWHSAKKKLFYVGAFVLLGGMFCMIGYYYWTKPNPETDGFEKFMDHQGWGVRFMMTALGVIVKLFWESIDQDHRRNAPYTLLLRSPSHPLETILTPHHASPISAIIPSFQNKAYLTLLISSITVLASFLPIFLANIAFSPAMTKDAYDICNFLSMSVLLLMIVGIVVLGISESRWRCGRGKGKGVGVERLPREPGKGGIAGTAMYVVGGLVDRLAEKGVGGMAGVGKRERDDGVIGLGGRYVLGVGRGGRIGVDDERYARRLW